MTLLKSARSFVADNIKPQFHDKRLDKAKALKLEEVLRRKNPYLFRAKAVNTAGDFVKQILDAYLSSQEETIFGAFLEGLAIDVCRNAYGGVKSTSLALDLDFTRDGTRYIVSIKSGPNWANARQKEQMLKLFRQAKHLLGAKTHVVAVNGCCYGWDKKPEKSDGYFKLCGQDFWELISGEKVLYTEIVEPLGVDAKRRTVEFDEAYAKVINSFTRDFIAHYCDVSGGINWRKLLEMNSGSRGGWELPVTQEIAKKRTPRKPKL